MKYIKPKYLILGVMIGGGAVMTQVGVSNTQQMIPDIFASQMNLSGVIPPAIQQLLYGSLAFGIAMGYLVKEIESGAFDDILDGKLGEQEE